MKPSKLTRWIKNHPGIVHEVDYGSGFGTESGYAYDILLCGGWCTVDGEHTIIEETEREAIAVLNGVRPCRGNCCSVPS